MTDIVLDIAPADVAASALTLRLGRASRAPALSAQTSAHPRLGGAAVMTAQILGYSHRIVIAGEERPFIEEVSCADSEATVAPLPQRWHGGGHRFAAQTRQISGSACAGLIRRLGENTAGASEIGMLARFPGKEFAVTAVLAQSTVTGWNWRTWHVYPLADGRADVVTTQSRWEAP